MSEAELFWDVGSPYTYLAITRLDGLRERTGATVRLRPFLLGGVFNATGNQMPASVAAKAKYLLEDLRRWRERYGVPLGMPVTEVPFPIKTLLPMRVAVAADRAGAGEAYCKAIFAAYWAQGKDVSQPEIVREVLASIGLDPDALLAAAETREVKDALRANTDEAVLRGAFGAPAIFVGDEMFWGNDRLDFVESLLKQP